MTDVPPIGRSAATYHRVAATGNNGSHSPAATTARDTADSFEVSPTARLLGQLNALPDVREDVVNQAKANIDAGVYDTDAVIDQTIDRLADDL